MHVTFFRVKKSGFEKKTSKSNFIYKNDQKMGLKWQNFPFKMIKSSSNVSFVDTIFLAEASCMYFLKFTHEKSSNNIVSELIIHVYELYLQ